MSKRISLLRNRKLISIRELAQRAAVDKNTITRLERGQPVRMETLTRVCEALETTPGRQLLGLGEPKQAYRVSRAIDRRWEMDPELMSQTDPQADIDRLHGEKVRWPLGWSGEHGGFNGFLDCELYDGAVVSSVIELFRSCKLRSFAGEELIYCLRGAVRLRISHETTLLGVGDAVCLWAEQEHACGPATRVMKGQAPPLILSVRVGRQ